MDCPFCDRGLEDYITEKFGSLWEAMDQSFHCPECDRLIELEYDEVLTLGEDGAVEDETPIWTVITSPEEKSPRGEIRDLLPDAIAPKRRTRVNQDAISLDAPERLCFTLNGVPLRIESLSVSASPNGTTVIVNLANTD